LCFVCSQANDFKTKELTTHCRLTTTP